MFEEAGRLLRQIWKKPQLLAEEIYCILTAKTPLTHNAPLTVNQLDENATDPPMTLGAFNLGDVAMKINHADGTLDLNKDGSMTSTDGAGTSTPIGGGGLIGRIVSGSGTTYTVDIYRNGLSAAATSRVTATAPYLDSDEALEAGDTVGVVQAGSVYHIQIGYWL